MTSLRDIFITQKQTTAEENVEAALEKVAKNLRKDIENHIRQKKTDQRMTFVLGMKLDDLNDKVDITQLEGYKRLHAICADPDVDVKIDIDLPEDKDWYELPASVLIYLDQPYSASPAVRSAAASTPVAAAAPAPSINASVLQMSGAALQELLQQIKKERPDDFSAVAVPKNPAALTHDIKATRPIGAPKPPATGP